MSDGEETGRIDGQAAIQLLRVLLIALIERGQLDGERLRQIVDDVVSVEADGDAEIGRRVAQRVQEVGQSTYAVPPVAASKWGGSRGDPSGSANDT